MKGLDLCCGRKGVSKEFEKAGWDMVTVDIDPRFNPTIIFDINDLHLESPGDYDFIWASPPCDEYTKWFLPASWKCNQGEHKLPDVKLFMNCYRIIRYLKPHIKGIVFVNIGSFRFYIRYVNSSRNHARSYSGGGAAGSAAAGPQSSMQVRGVGSGWMMRQP